MPIVGMLTAKHNELAQTALPCGPIYQSPGFAVHVVKHHPNCAMYLGEVAAILASPDYIGANPREPDSIEMVKRLDANILVAVKLDRSRGYLYVASLYDVTPAKVQARLASGRLREFRP
jgi:hypothetical protein